MLSERMGEQIADTRRTERSPEIEAMRNDIRPSLMQTPPPALASVPVVAVTTPLRSNGAERAEPAVMDATSHPPMLPTDAVRLILVRHGEVVANREMRYLGSRDDPLTEHGVDQARRLAERLRILPIAGVYASPRRRTLDTAGAIAAAHELFVEPRIGLRETEYGQWEGYTRAELLATDAETAARLHAWEHDPALAPPGGESLLATETRVMTEVEMLRRRHVRQIIVIVSHVGPIKSIIRRAIGLPAGSGNLFLDPATISVVDYGASSSMLRLFNAHGHLGWENARWIGG